MLKQWAKFAVLTAVVLSSAACTKKSVNFTANKGTGSDAQSAAVAESSVEKTQVVSDGEVATESVIDGADSVAKEADPSSDTQLAPGEASEQTPAALQAAKEVSKETADSRFVLDEVMEGGSKTYPCFRLDQIELAHKDGKTKTNRVKVAHDKCRIGYVFEMKNTGGAKECHTYYKLRKFYTDAKNKWQWHYVYEEGPAAEKCVMDVSFETSPNGECREVALTFERTADLQEWQTGKETFTVGQMVDKAKCK